jgi:hypothetical protein
VARCQEHECEEALVGSGEHKQHPGELWVERQAQRRAHMFIFYRRAASFCRLCFISVSSSSSLCSSLCVAAEVAVKLIWIQSKRTRPHPRLSTLFFFLKNMAPKPP